MKHEKSKKWQHIDREELNERLFKQLKNINEVDVLVKEIEGGETIEQGGITYRRDPKELEINQKLERIQQILETRREDWEELVRRRNNDKLDLGWLKKEFPEIVEILQTMRAKDVWKYGYIPATVVFGEFMK